MILLAMLSAFKIVVDDGYSRRTERFVQDLSLACHELGAVVLSTVSLRPLF